MAIGTDGAILIKATGQQLDPYITAKVFKGAIEYSGKNLIYPFCDNKELGDESGQAP